MGTKKKVGRAASPAPDPLVRQFCVALIGLLLLSCSCARAPRQAVAEIRNAQGQSIGKAVFEELQEGVRIKVAVTGLAPGKHGMHLHEVGRCDPPDFQSAGDHFNPTGGVHAEHHAGGGHAGDLPNLTVGPDGGGRAEFVATEFNLRRGGHHSLLRGDGSSLLIHAREDDMKSSPSGNAGERIACGVVVLSPTGT